MLNFCDFIQVYVFTTNHHLKMNLLVSVMVSYSLFSLYLSILLQGVFSW